MLLLHVLKFLDASKLSNNEIRNDTPIIIDFYNMIMHVEILKFCVEIFIQSIK